MSTRGSGEDLWDDFVREFEKDKAAGGGSAAAAEPVRQPERRRSRRRLLLPVAAALLVAAGAAAYLLRPSDPAPAAAPAPGAPAPGAPVGSAPGSAAATQPIAAPSAAADTPASAAVSPSAIPLSVFPTQVPGYTLVAGVARSNCTGPDTVAPTLAGLITQGHGCLGVDLALYKDAEGNQFNVALFTMADQGDGVHLVTFLGAHADSFQVAVHVPPTDSGLRRLPVGSGRVQSFAAYGHSMLVGSAQWSDGRTTDLDTLVQRLSPLTDAVLKSVPA
ncbi:hypothetical protein ACFZDG_12950 [Kitasatospora xanthocidica]|uniref:hypothetical protein n=1 Tax=Kitasatospora xanthocidica TaxID=83382 RepID=UPI0036E26577